MTIKDFSALIPASLLDQSGAVFYSGENAFRGKATVYLLGLNPGGDPREMATETIRRHTEGVLAKEDPNWSEYRDESWNNKAPGKAGLQPRVLHLLEQLNLDPRRVPSSNVVFLRTRSQADLKGRFQQLADECWPLHQAVIDRLRPKLVVCFGQMAGGYVRKKLGATTKKDDFKEKNRRHWTSTLYCSETGVGVLVATHPSKARWQSPETDPSGLAVNWLGQ